MPTKYVSKTPDSQGYVAYTDEENETWQMLYERQIEIVKGRACDLFFDGIDIISLAQDGVPQLPEVTKALQKETGWSVVSVPALIPAKQFFTLLANKQFPAATFIRTREEFDYLREPDIFHELFGHCPLLVNPDYANFVEEYGKLCLTVPPKERTLLLRLFWFTIEFGLMDTPDGLRAYGAGMLSSPEETPYSVESDIPQRKPFDLMDVLRTPYRVDIKQPIYYILDKIKSLDDFLKMDLRPHLQQAIELGDYPPLFPPRKPFKVEIEGGC